LNVRFAFDYKPTMRALGVGLAAVLLSGVAFLMLRSGETTVNTSLAAGSDALHANTAESSVGQSVPVPASQATAPAVARAARSKPPRRKKARPQPTVAENSHLRITDSRASTALSGLSRYEILSLRRKAEYGDDSAAFVLGMAYEVGHGVPRSCSQAAKWVTVAAQQGNPAAEYNLSLRYRTADGVRANPDEAEKWFRKAARKRYAHAAPALTAAKLEDSHSAGQPYR
jgi:TPR repeat protein